MHKLNLGCGNRPINEPEWINVDSHNAPGVDVLWDLEVTPWRIGGDIFLQSTDNKLLKRFGRAILDTSSVDSVEMSHVLEHIGQTPSVFINFMQELYRVCCNEAIIQIAVPHPRHDDFLSDPTHVRPILPSTMALFSKKNCLEWQEKGYANTPLALMYDIDFEILGVQFVPEIDSADIGMEYFNTALRMQNNICKEIKIQLKAVK